MNIDLIKSADKLERAVVISLFTWARAEPYDPVDDSELYGYWGDSFPDVAKDKIGSRLWLLRRRTLTDQTIKDARRYAKEALQWMLDDEIVTAVNVAVQRANNDRLDLIVVIDFDNDQKEFKFTDVLGVINAV